MRLHLGLLDLNGDMGRHFGSIGVAIQRPNVVVEAARAPKWQIEGSEQERVRKIIETFRQHYPLPGSARIRVQENILSHVGLGSGTQLTLATATALARLYGLQIPLAEMALNLGRGKRSGIGMAAFQNGGFVVAGGMAKERKTIPPLLFRQPFPDNWFFVVAIPKPENKGLSGETELQAFRDLPIPSAETVGHICRLLVMNMLPALIEQDIAEFGAAMTDIQGLVGDCFSPQQPGGRFATAFSAQMIKYMLQNGAYGAGQSSWGPTIYALVEGKQQAHRLSEDVRAFIQQHGTGIVFPVAADNQGHTAYERD